MTAILYYVTGHGFGHAVRSAEIMRALLERAPGVRVLVRTDAPAWLFPLEVEHVEAKVDVGLVQQDSLAHDVGRTLARLEPYLAGLADLAEREAAIAIRAGVGVVVGDIPPLAFEVAARLEVPGLAVGNFSWDEIYQGLEARPAAFDPLIERVREAYRRVTLLLRLPFHLPMAAFRRVEDVPLVVRRASRSPAETRAELGLSSERPVVLLSFGGYDLSGFDFQALAPLRDYTFIATPLTPLDSLPPNVLQLERRQANYTDLVAASNAVVTKPGYGIVADCLAHRVPVVYTDREDFPEYPVLARALETLGRAQYLPRDRLRRGDLGPALATVLAQDRPWAPLRLGGAEVVAGQVLNHLAGRSPSDTVLGVSGVRDQVSGGDLIPDT